MNKVLVMGLIGFLTLVSCGSKSSISVVSASCQVERVWQDDGLWHWGKVETTYWSDGSKTTSDLGWPSTINYYAGAPCS